MYRSPQLPSQILPPFVGIDTAPPTRRGCARAWERGTTEWSTTLASPLSDPSLASSRLMRMNAAAKSRTTPWSAAGFTQS